MNNAANNIVVSTKSLKGLLLEKRFKVGYFQREYKWKKENIEDLLIDLERSFFSNWEEGHIQTDVARYDKYCMGPIVLYQDGAEFSIVDGQQRLTSFTLLLIYLNLKYDALYKQRDKLKGYIYSEYYGTETYNLNIGDRTKALDFLFKKIPLDEAIALNESTNNIIDRYQDIGELFPERLLSLDIFSLYVNWLTDNLVFIEILTQTSDSAYTIFETMNDRGLKLTQSELLKSYLLSNVVEDEKIRELDNSWKKKIVELNKYSADNEQVFFMAWLRAKYAVTIRTAEKGAVNEDFEKIGTRYSNWVQENATSKLQLDKSDSSSYYYFVHSDFQFYSDIFLKLAEYEYGSGSNEHRFKLLSYKGISNSLSYPFILASIEKVDDSSTVMEKVETAIKYLDSFAGYRLLLNEPITHSSIRNAIYLKIKSIRNTELNILKEKLQTEINEYKNKFLNEMVYVPFNSQNAKYILSRLYKNLHPHVLFEAIYFQRKKDSFVLYQIMTNSDFDVDVQKMPKGLKDIFISNLCSYAIVPKNYIVKLDGLSVQERIKFLLKENLILEFANDATDLKDLQSFFILKNKKLKEMIVNLWKVQ
jgi:uncharacterized protein with ParB-like and HNH nuclease domain